MLVDGHAHVASPEVAQYPPAETADPRLLEDPFDVEKLLVALRDEGLDHAVLVQRSSVYGVDNRYVLDAAEAHADRVSAVVAIDGHSPDASTEVDYAVRRGAKGIRFRYPGRPTTEEHFHDTSWFASDTAQAAWRRAAELEVPVCIHFLRMNRDPCLAGLSELLTRLPEVRVVVDHLANCEAEQGPPDYGMSVLRPIDRPGVSFKVAPINFRTLGPAGLAPSAFVRRAVDLFGPDRVFYGSDVTNSPGTHAELMVAGQQAAEELTAHERAEFLGEAVARIYRIPAGSN